MGNSAPKVRLFLILTKCFLLFFYFFAKNVSTRQYKPTDLRRDSGQYPNRKRSYKNQ